MSGRIPVSTGTDGMHGLRYPAVDANGQQIPGDAWVPVNADFEGQNLTYYELAEGYEKAGDFLTNRPDYNRSFNGVELAIHKRMADNWMMNAAYSYNSATEGFGSNAAIARPHQHRRALGRAGGGLQRRQRQDSASS